MQDGIIYTKKNKKHNNSVYWNTHQNTHKNTHQNTHKKSVADLNALETFDKFTSAEQLYINRGSAEKKCRL